MKVLRRHGLTADVSDAMRRAVGFRMFGGIQDEHWGVAIRR